jgi:hypothetical protein
MENNSNNIIYNKAFLSEKDKLKNIINAIETIRDMDAYVCLTELIDSILLNNLFRKLKTYRMPLHDIDVYYPDELLAVDFFEEIARKMGINNFIGVYSYSHSKFYLIYIDEKDNRIKFKQIVGFKLKNPTSKEEKQ